MRSENDLLQKLMISKKVMDIHNKMPRGGSGSYSVDIPEVEGFDVPNSKFEIPQEFLGESEMLLSTPPQKTNQPVTRDRIMSSKLPDEIKMLMIEHPIQQPDQMTGPSLSNDLIEKASRLMNLNTENKQVTPKKQPTQESPTGVNPKVLKQMIRETIEEVLGENGLLIESTSKTNDIFSFRVGEHIFEGKLTKIKKIVKK